jgi:hypothetical protein
LIYLVWLFLSVLCLKYNVYDNKYQEKLKSYSLKRIIYKKSEGDLENNALEFPGIFEDRTICHFKYPLYPSRLDGGQGWPPYGHPLL